MSHSPKRSVSIVPFLVGALLLMSMLTFVIWNETRKVKPVTNATLIEDENGKLIQLDNEQFLTVITPPGAKESSFLPPGVYRVTDSSTSRHGHKWRLVPALSAPNSAHITIDDNELAREKDISVITVTRTISPFYEMKKWEWGSSKKN